MKLKPIVLSLAAFAIVGLAPFSFAQELDGSEVRREVRERDEKVSKLSTEEQLKLRAAMQNAAQDPEVKAALEKRNKAIEEFRAALDKSMIRADPTIKPILDRVAIGADRRP